MACLNVANQLLTGAGGPADPARAMGLLEQACGGGELVACLRLAHLARDGAPAISGSSSVNADLHRAVTLYAQVCEAGVFEGCVALATELEGDAARSGRPDEAIGEAFSLYTRACQAGFPDGCTGQARMQLVEPTIAARTSDAARARAVLVLERACFGGTLRACGAASAALAAGMAELPADPVRAGALRERGCAMGDSSLCGPPSSDGDAPTP